MSTLNKRSIEVLNEVGLCQEKGSLIPEKQNLSSYLQMEKNDIVNCYLIFVTKY
jgi:hypothetical protein